MNMHLNKNPDPNNKLVFNQQKFCDLYFKKYTFDNLNSSDHLPTLINVINITILYKLTVVRSASVMWDNG